MLSEDEVQDERICGADAEVLGNEGYGTNRLLSPLHRSLMRLI